MPELIYTAHRVLEELLTGVSAVDIETALERCCPDWDASDRHAVLRLAAEFACIRAEALAMAAFRPPDDARAALEHTSFIAEELADHLSPRAIRGYVIDFGALISYGLAVTELYA
jgi:hypothetical protein